jgi:hypothetical protein
VIWKVAVSFYCTQREGLAMGWYSMFLSPGRQPIEKLKPKVNTKS